MTGTQGLHTCGFSREGIHSPGTMHVSASARRASFAMSAVPFSFVWMPSGMKCVAHAGVRGRQPAAAEGAVKF